jgi:transaldolase
MTPTPRQTKWATATTTGPVRRPTALLRLFVEHGQSPWLAQLSRDDLEDGSLSRMVHAGMRGVVATRTTGATAIETSDVQAACAILRPVYDSSQATDGFVSVEASPASKETGSAAASARRLQQQIDRPNLMVAIPASPRGLPAVQAMVSIGANINATSIVSIARYSAVIDAYLSGLEAFIVEGGE